MPSLAYNITKLLKVCQFLFGFIRFSKSINKSIQPHGLDTTPFFRHPDPMTLQSQWPCQVWQRLVTWCNKMVLPSMRFLWRQIDGNFGHKRWPGKNGDLKGEEFDIGGEVGYLSKKAFIFGPQVYKLRLFFWFLRKFCQKSWTCSSWHFTNSIETWHVHGFSFQKGKVVVNQVLGHSWPFYLYLFHIICSSTSAEARFKMVAKQMEPVVACLAQGFQWGENLSWEVSMWSLYVYRL